MISAASNCCRVDAVKASANQLKTKFAQHATAAAPAMQVRSATQQLQALDIELRSGDASKAELALSAAKAAVAQLDYAGLSTAQGRASARYGVIDIQI